MNFELTGEDLAFQAEARARGVIPRQDYGYLIVSGVLDAFGPGTNVLDAARAVLHLMERKWRKPTAVKTDYHSPVISPNHRSSGQYNNVSTSSRQGST